mmetsp:Transcript_62511/g.165885  ORF Transcript_62511/g.165885 Transcript_62511/m.165885 type:complete len:284 (-) Transcript_62511:285-1136(-)
MTSVHTMADPGACAHVRALELVAARTVAQPTSFTDAEGAEIRQHCPSQAVPISDDVVVHAIWPWLVVHCPVRSVVGEATQEAVLVQVPETPRSQRRGVLINRSLRVLFQVFRWSREVLIQRSRQAQGSRHGARETSQVHDALEVVVRFVIGHPHDLRRLVHFRTPRLIVTLLYGLHTRQLPAFHSIRGEHIGASVATLSWWQRAVARTTRRIGRFLSERVRGTAFVHCLWVIAHIAHRRSVLVQSSFEHSAPNISHLGPHDILVVEAQIIAGKAVHRDIQNHP